MRILKTAWHRLIGRGSSNPGRGGARSWLLGVGLLVPTLCWPGSTEAAGPSDPHGLNDPWRWRHFSTESGLPSGRIIDICEAADGTVWASTTAGLAWYDGYRWRTVGPAEGLPAAPLTGLAADERGKVLVFAGGVLYRGGRTGMQRFRPTLDDAEYVVAAVAPLGQHEYFLVGRNRRTDQSVLFMADRWEVTRVDGPNHPQDPEVFDVWSSSDESILARARGGLYRWAEGSWVLHLASQAPRGDITRVSESDGIAFGWVGRGGVDRGLWEWSEGPDPVLVLPQHCGRFSAVASGSDGFALAVEDTGVIHVRQHGVWAEFESGGPQFAGVTSLEFSSNGDLWVGTDHGLYVHSAVIRLWDHWKDRSPGSLNRITEIVEARDGHIWITSTEGVQVRDPDGTVRRINDIAGQRMCDSTGIAEDGRGAVWVTSGGAYEGVFRFDGSNWQHFGSEQGLPGYRHKVRIDRRGRPWFLGLGDALDNSNSYGVGVAVYENDRFTHWTTRDGLLHDRVYAFAEGLEGEYWFGTAAGLSRLEDGEWTHWTIANGLAKSRIWAITVDRDNTVWFTDRLNGLGTVRDGVPQYLTTEDGLIDNQIQDVRADPRGGLWLTCSGAVQKYRQGRWYTFRAADGLGHSSFWPVLPTEDHIYVGTLGEGVAVLDRLALEDADLHVEVVKPAMREGSALLHWHATAREALVAESQIETRYLLDDEGWSEWSVEHPGAVVVGSGSHSLVVQARCRLADSPAASARISFDIPYPVHRHPLFLLMTAGTFLAVVLSAVMMIIRQSRSVEVLRESEGRFRTMADTTPVMVWMSGPDGAITYLNRTWHEFTGRTLEEEYGAGSPVSVHPEDVEESWAAYRAAVAARVRWRSEHRLRRSDGEYRWVRVTGVPRFAADGSFLGFVGSCVDVDDHRRAEETLRISHTELEGRVAARTRELQDANDRLRKEIAERLAAQQAQSHSEERFRLFLNNLNDVAYETDTRGNVTYVNRAAERLTGLPVEEIVNRPFLPLFDNEGQKVVMGIYERSLAGESLEFELTLAAGPVCQFSNTPMRDKEGKIIGVLGTARDITERKRTELALAASEEKYRSLFENAPIGIYRTTPDGRIDGANPALIRMLAFPDFRELAKRNLESEGFEPEYGRRTFRERLEREGVIGGLEATWIRQDGCPIIVRENTRVVRDASGKAVFYEGTVEDITEQKRAENALRVSEEWFRSVFDGSRDAIFIVDENAAFVDVNQAAADLTEYSQDELRGMTIPDVHGPEDRTALDKHFAEIMAGIPITSQAKLLTKSGRRVTTEFSNRRITVDGIDYMHTTARDITQRTRMQRELRDSQERFELAALGSSDGLWDWSDLSSDVEWWSPRCFELLGYAVNEFEPNAKSFHELLHQNDRDRVARALREHLERRAAYDVEYRLRTKSGEYRWFRARGQALWNKAGKPTRMSGSFQDIHDRKVAQEEERRLLEEMRFLSRTTMEFVDLPPEQDAFELIAEHLHELVKDAVVVTSAVDASHERAVIRAIRGEGRLFDASDSLLGQNPVGSTFVFERSLQTRDLRSKLTKLRGAPREPPEGSVPDWILQTLHLLPGIGDLYTIPVLRKGEILGNVTIGLYEGAHLGNAELIETYVNQASVVLQRRLAEEALRESEQRLDLAVAGSHGGCWDIVLDPSSPQTIPEDVFLSNRLKALIGFAEKEFPDSWQAWRDRIPPEDLKRLDEDAQKQLAGREELSEIEYRIRHRDGGIRWMLCRGRIQRNTRNEPVRWSGIDWDITERKNIEEALERHRFHLEELVEERTRELDKSREQLRQAERLASIGTLAAGIAHEINNPVGGILLAAQNARELMEQANDPELLDTCLEDVIDNAKRCSQIIQSVLQFARQRETEKWAYNLNAVIRRVATLTRQFVENRGGLVELQLSPDVPATDMNPFELEQVFVNLIRNALQTGDGMVSVLIRTEKTTESVRAIVQDSAGGIPVEHIKHLFDPFFTTRREYGGTGLGLSIVHGIITEHQGAIDVRSRPGRGTTFIIDLPLCSATTTEEGNRESSDSR